MEIKTYKDTFNLFFSKVAKLFNHFFPGVVILELFFNKGYFSSPPTDIFSFLLFIIWIGIFSIPFHSIIPNSIERLETNLFKTLCKLNDLSYEEFEQNLDNESKEEFGDIVEGLNLGFILIRLLMTYIVFKLLVFSGFPQGTFLEIPINICQLFTTLFVVLLLSYPVGYLYSKIFIFLLIRYMKKE